MNTEIRSKYYRLSAKALVLDDSRNKFLIIKEDNGRWDIPGGGIEWGENAHIGLQREIEEEMGLKTTRIDEHPSYFLVSTNWNGEVHIANVVYETELESLDFTPTPECIEMKFVDTNEISDLNVCPNVKVFAEMFDPKRHVR